MGDLGVSLLDILPLIALRKSLISTLVRVSHPLSSAMQSYPYIVGVSVSRARDMAGGYVQYHPGQRWMLLGGQQSFELLVCRVASSGVGNDVVGK